MISPETVVLFNFFFIGWITFRKFALKNAPIRIYSTLIGRTTTNCIFLIKQRLTLTGTDYVAQIHIVSSTKCLNYYCKPDGNSNYTPRHAISLESHCELYVTTNKFFSIHIYSVYV